jgi:hypothetical protein
MLDVIRTVSNKTFISLLSSGLFFICMAIGGFFLSEQHFRYYDRARESGSEEKFEKFVESVKSGKRQITTDQWIEAMRTQRKLTESERRIGIGIARDMRDDAWYLLIGVACHVLVVCYVRQKNKEP